MNPRTGCILPLTEPVDSLSEYLSRGGSEGLATALRRSPDDVIAEIRTAGLRGRGGAGFPTADKWTSVRGAGGPTRYVVCNAAEGEPGTFKDRYILRRNPYLVLEGTAIAAHAVGASRAFVVVKRRYEQELARLRRALAELTEADLLGPVPVQLVLGPDEYLFGEEKAALEVIEGGEPLPRIFPPYQVGVYAKRDSRNPTAVNNVETLAHVPTILCNGAAWFRTSGTDATPGSTVFTVSGDIRRPGVYELPFGLPMRVLLELVAGGPANGGRIKAVVPGASAGLLTEDKLDTALDFESMWDAGSGLGSAGFVVYDDSTCMVAATLAFARFLAVESCGQCPACKHGTEEISESLDRIERGLGTEKDLDSVRKKVGTVTGGRRCALPLGAEALVGSALEAFGDEFTAHLGRPCPLPRDLPVPKLVDYDDATGRFRYDEAYRLKRPDWTYASAAGGDGERSA
ncbi:MAG TPA: NADH-ubiquinone oxidoreductase-F iron-sulfur binding region domain-containing protein [Mycobacteriales bacterium]|jgi:NADH:ubiquinone oxidoreductase subunit F (NADH-binding)